MAQFCTECGASVGPGKKFCTGCGAKIEAAEPVPVQMPLPERDAGPAVSEAAPAIRPNEKPIGMLVYLGYLIVMIIPLVGLVMSIVWGVKSPPTNSGNLAKAMIVINVIWLIVFVLLAIWAYSLFSQLSRVVNISFDIFGLKIF